MRSPAPEARGDLLCRSDDMLKPMWLAFLRVGEVPAVAVSAKETRCSVECDFCSVACVSVDGEPSGLARSVVAADTITREWNNYQINCSAGRTDSQ